MSRSKNNFSDIIKAIEDVNSSNLLDVHVPSLARHVKFTPLKVSHQKKIIETALESTSLNPTHNTLMSSDIIHECCVEKDINWLAIDRDPVMIGLRSQSLGTQTTVQNPDGDDVAYDIKEHVQTFPSLKPTDGLFDEKHVSEGNIHVVVRAPSMQRDDEVNKHALPGKKSPSTTEDIKHIIGDAITYEYIKYIEQISIGDVVVQFDTRKTKELVGVVESLPMSISKKLVDQINIIKNFEREFTQIKTEQGVLSIITDARFYHSE